MIGIPARRSHGGVRLSIPPPGEDADSAAVFRNADTPRRAELFDDDLVNGDDLLRILGAPGRSDRCPEDVNGDGVIATDNQSGVTATWGSCDRVIVETGVTLVRPLEPKESRVTSWFVTKEEHSLCADYIG